VSTYVLDASVAVAAVRPSEPSHQAARARLAALLTGKDAIVVPAIFDVEVTSALVRAQASGASAAEYLERDLGARQLVTCRRSSKSAGI
jgi:predicted nucleic acid-binding protein